MSEWFLNSKKKQMKSENYKICHDVMISHMKAVIKSLEEFAHLFIPMFTKSKHVTRSICVIVCERVNGFIFWIQTFLFDFMWEKLYTKVVQPDEI